MADIDIVQKPDHCHPNHAAPHHEEHEECRGKIVMEACCHKMKTRTFVINIGPQTEAALQTFEQNTFNAWENAGFLILGHSIVDTGAGWKMALTIGWYV